MSFNKGDFGEWDNRKGFNGVIADNLIDYLFNY